MTNYEIAKQYVGLQEVKDRSVLMKLMKKQGFDIDPATTPWCAAFIGTIEKMAGNPSTGKLNARSYLKYGKEVKLKDATPGDIVIFSRGGSSWQGHVAYFAGISSDSNGNPIIRTLGGNQSDAVTVGFYPLSRLLGIRRYA